MPRTSCSYNSADTSIAQAIYAAKMGCFHEDDARIPRFAVMRYPELLSLTTDTLFIAALVMAPNILRPLSMASDMVFANTAFETALIVNLLEHLDVNSADPDYTPELPNPAPRLPSTLTMSDVF